MGSGRQTLILIGAGEAIWIQLVTIIAATDEGAVSVQTGLHAERSSAGTVIRSSPTLVQINTGEAISVQSEAVTADTTEGAVSVSACVSTASAGGGTVALVVGGGTLVQIDAGSLVHVQHVVTVAAAVETTHSV